MNLPAIPRNRVLQPTLADGTSIKIIGLGGVGSIVARYGAVFIGSQETEARLVLIDGDSFEPTNASRMMFRDYGKKVRVLCDELLPYFQDTNLSLVAIDEYVSEENLSRLIHKNDIVLLTVDNHATRKLVNNHCSQLDQVCLISGGNDGVGKDSSGRIRRGTYGNVQIHVRQEGEDITPSLTRFHPEIMNPADQLPTEKHCTELIRSEPQILFANLAVASAILNTLWLYLCGAVHYGELSLDIAEGLMRPHD